MFSFMHLGLYAKAQEHNMNPEDNYYALMLWATFKSNIMDVIRLHLPRGPPQKKISQM